MSVDVNIYLGPYALYPVPLVVRRTDRCPRPDGCPDPREGFCPRCGLDVSRRFAEESVPAARADLATLTEDRLVGAAQMADHPRGVGSAGAEVSLFRVVPNLVRGGPSGRPLCWQGREATDESCDMTGLDPVEELKWLVEFYQPDLLRVAEALGVPYSLRWGLLKWCS